MKASGHFPDKPQRDSCGETVGAEGSVPDVTGAGKEAGGMTDEGVTDESMAAVTSTADGTATNESKPDESATDGIVADVMMADGGTAEDIPCGGTADSAADHQSVCGAAADVEEADSDDEADALLQESVPERGIRPLLSALTVSALLTLAFIAVNGVCGFVWALVTGADISEALYGGELPVFVKAASRVFILLICAAVYKRRGSFSMDFPSAQNNSARKTARTVIYAVILGVSLQIFFGFIFNPGAFRGEAPIGAAFAFSDSASWQALAVSCVLSPLAEEALFRGLIFGGLRRSSDRSWLVAAAISSLLFSLVHSPAALMCVAFFAGLVFAFTVWKSGSVFTALLVHASFNAASYFSGYIPLASAYINISVFILSALLCAFSLFSFARLSKPAYIG